MENTYNGWTNYPTWRIKLEMFDDASVFAEEQTCAESLRDLAEEIVCEGVKNEGCKSYALAFLADVNWYEIANSINQDNKAEKEYNAKKKRA